MKFIVAASIISVVFASEGLEIDTNSGHSLYVQDEPAPAYNACPNFLFAAPVCGAVNVLGLACLDVAPVPTQPLNADDFRALCARTGKQAMCATLPLLGQGLLCKPAEAGKAEKSN